MFVHYFPKQSGKALLQLRDTSVFTNAVNLRDGSLVRSDQFIATTTRTKRENSTQGVGGGVYSRMTERFFQVFFSGRNSKSGKYFLGGLI